MSQMVSQAKPWLDSYPVGVPHQVDYAQYTSLNHLFEESFRQYAERNAFECMGVNMTYRELDVASQQFAAYLQSLGLKQGDRIALMMPNVLQYPIAIIGVLRAGLVVVNVNPLYTPRELEHQLKDSGAKAIIVLENFAHVFQQIQKNVPVEHVVVTSMGELMGFKGKILILSCAKLKN